MVGHAFRKFIVDPEIKRQIEEYSEFRDADALVRKLMIMAATSPVSDNGLVVNVATNILHNLYLEDILTREQYHEATDRLYNAAIEAGDFLKTGGPASAPFTDESFNAFKGALLTWSNFFANMPINGESTWMDTPKNIVFYGTARWLLQQVNDIKEKYPDKNIPEEFIRPIKVVAEAGANLGLSALELFNPSIITRPFVSAVKNHADTFRDKLVFAAILNLQMAQGNLASVEA
jgi:hypothetical protein